MIFWLYTLLLAFAHADDGGAIRYRLWKDCA